VVEDASVSLNDLPADLRLVFKTLLKKDISTRIKGLCELRSWLSNCQDEDEFIMARPQFVSAWAFGLKC
jgi:hypothetical protein